MSATDRTQRHPLYEAAWLGYVVGSLSIVFGASQVAPDGWRRVASASLLLFAAVAAATAYRFRRVRPALSAFAIVAVIAALPVALLPSSVSDHSIARGTAPPINTPASDLPSG